MKSRPSNLPVPGATVATPDRPGDFHDFWAESIAITRRIDPQVAFYPDDVRSNEAIAVHRVEFTSFGGLRIKGWYAAPSGKQALPAVVILPGYSAASFPPVPWARAGFAALSLGIRGHHPSDDAFRPGFPGLLVHGLPDRDTYVYRGAYMDAWRAVQALRTRPEVDRRRIALTGRSQGGGLAIACAVLAPEVAAIAVDVPFLTGFRHASTRALAYPYREIADYLRQRADQREQVFRTLDYYDALTFAPEVACPVLLAINLKDDVVPPETAFALAQRLENRVQVCTYEAGHEPVYVHDMLKVTWLTAILEGRAESEGLTKEARSCGS